MIIWMVFVFSHLLQQKTSSSDRNSLKKPRNFSIAESSLRKKRERRPLEKNYRKELTG